MLHNNFKKETVVIVGGGPIGLINAYAIKKFNPTIQVIVKEKYEVYQRSHTLVVQHQLLAELMKAIEAEKDSYLSALLRG